MNGETHIVSLIVHVIPEYRVDVLNNAKQLPQSECHTDNTSHKFVIVFEVESEAALAIWFDQINSWQGVLSTQLCYHHCEPDESLNEEIQNATYTS